MAFFRPVVGQISIPLVDTCQGYVRELQVYRDECIPVRSIDLDLVCSLLQRACREYCGRFFFFRPEQFYCSITTIPAKTCEKIVGRSYELPLFMALTSLLTGDPLPLDISASAQLSDDGSLVPVKGIEQKINALGQERHYIRRFLVAHDQSIENNSTRIEVVRLKNVTEVLEYMYKPSKVIFLDEPFDLDEEFRNLVRSYSNYRFHYCISIAEAIIDSPKISRRPKELFTAYWYRGSCYCHFGKVEEALNDFKKAEGIYKRHGDHVAENDYISMLNNKGVICKDIFRYNKALEIYHNNSEILDLIGAESYDKAKNISSLSQMLSAMGLHDEAIETQRKALSIMKKAGKDLYRNYGYLANIYTRAGDYRRAIRNLSEARKCYVREQNKNTHDVFLDWYEAELRYRRICTERTNVRQQVQKLKGLAAHYPEIADYSHAQALVHKFAGLAVIRINHLPDNEFLHKALVFFEKQEIPMYRLIAASVRIERQLILLSCHDHFHLSVDLQNINSSLSCQPDILRFFKPMLRDLARFQQAIPKTGPQKVRLLSILSKMLEKIPY